MKLEAICCHFIVNKCKKMLSDLIEYCLLKIKKSVNVSIQYHCSSFFQIRKK